MNFVTFILFLILIPAGYIFMWLFFEENGKPGWHSLISPLNEWKMMEIIWKKLNGKN